MATLPAIQPDYASAKSVTPRVLRSQFGDGYAQRAADGINFIVDEWEVSWSNRLEADIDTLEAFFEGLGADSFDWTPPREGSAKKFSCTTYIRTLISAGCDTLTASFRQEFDLS